MKLLEIFLFELRYQSRRAWPWLSAAVLMVFAFFNTRIAILPVTLPQDFILNSPFVIAVVTVFSCQVWLLVGPAVAGEAGARDVHTGIHPLIYTSAITRAHYVGGRFLAALVINALILLGVQIGSLLAVYGPGANPSIVGPFRPAAYLAAYGLIALPNAFIAMSIQFSLALRSGRPMASYLGSLILFFFSYPVTVALYFSHMAKPQLAMLTDAIGVFSIMNVMMSEWTIVEKNVRMFALEGPMVWNRLLWIAIGFTTLAVTFARFRFAHRTVGDLWGGITRRFAAQTSSVEESAERIRVVIPQTNQKFGFSTHVRQMVAIASSSFRMIAKSPAGLFLLIAFPIALVLMMQADLQHWGVPLMPRTFHVLTKFLTAPVTDPLNYWVMVPLLTIYFSGELLWRERDARLSESMDAAPVPEWVLLIGKFLGLALLLVTLMAVLTIAGIVTQLVSGYHEFEIVRYIEVLFGFQLAEYLLFAMLAFAVQIIVNQKYAGQLAALVAYLLMVFAPLIGIEHNLLIYARSPQWMLTDMRGLGHTVGPFVWFKLYWAAWALLLAVAARLLWARGKDTDIKARLGMARQRFTRSTIAAAFTGAALVLTLGGFIFYNTNVLNEYLTDDQSIERSAQYEREYGRYARVPQPENSATKLRVEIYPERGEITMQGSYRLVNRTAVAIDSVHVEPAPGVETRVAFDDQRTRAVSDEKLRHDIYALERPLAPGDSITLNFQLRVKPRGFRNSGIPRAVAANGTYFTSSALPSIGYQSSREIMSADDRRKHNLPRKLTFPTPDDVDPSLGAGSGELFDAVIGTDSGQTAVAPGVLRRTWNDGDRRYFHYVSDVPIGGQHTFMSAKYAVRSEKWNDVSISYFSHPSHTNNVDRIARSVHASLDYYSSQFGPYPYQFLQLVEQPSKGFGMGVDGSGVVTVLEGVSLLNPRRDDGVDAVFEITAHEMGHQWWGAQLKHAFAEGAIVLSESLAWYSGMQVVKKERGAEGLRQFMRLLREPYPHPPVRTGLPLLRAMDPYAGYRKGAFVMYALSEYVGEEKVNLALRRLIEKNKTSLVTTLDLYRELKSVTPDSLQSLLHDTFEVNTFWKFDTKKATAVETSDGRWRVSFDVEASKIVADSAGVETTLPMTETVEIGIFAAVKPGERLGKPIYVQKHRVRSGLQTITVVVSDKPARGGIDPYNLLDWEEGDNIETIELPASK